MITTGYKLREAIREWTLKRDAASNQFNDSLYKFDGEVKDAPQDVVSQFLQAETAVAKLQACQAQYNLNVNVTVAGLGTMTLCEAVKRIGGLGRVEKMWRTAVGEKKDRYSLDRDLVKRSDETRAARVLTPRTAVEMATKAAAVAGTLRAAIAEGNGTKVDIPTLDPSLFSGER